MSPTDRLVAERQHHDAQAREAAEFFAEHRSQLRFADDDYLDHESWIRPAFGLLGDLRGKRGLDYGCGHGMAAVVMVRRGATVAGFDLSPEYVREAGERARANGVEIAFQEANAERLPYADASFDVVWGCAILHHLDLQAAGRELGRVLRPGGIAVFCEPWGENPLLNLARKRLPYPGRDRTADESPLRMSDLEPLRQQFGKVHVRGFQLLGMLRRAWHRTNRLLPFLDAWDRTLLRRFPSLNKWCRYAVISLEQ